MVPRAAARPRVAPRHHRGGRDGGGRPRPRRPGRPPTAASTAGVRTDPPDLARACRRSLADFDALSTPRHARPPAAPRRRGHPLVRGPLRPRQPDRRPPGEGLPAGPDAGHARSPRGPPGAAAGPGERGAARQDPARGPADAAGVAGSRHHRGGSPVLRVDRRHPPLPDPLRDGRPVGAPRRRHRGAAAGRAGRPRLDPGLRRPRRRRPAGVPLRRRPVARQPELEGLRERGPVRRRQPRRGPDRDGGGPGLRLPRPARAGRRPAVARGRGARRTPSRRRPPSCGS